jgi:sortase B
MKAKTRIKRIIKSRKFKVALGAAIAALAILAIAALLVPHEQQRMEAQPTAGRVDTPALPDTEVKGIDWDYWKGVNPDIVGWITIPGTHIDYPLVQATKDAPEFYLHHDAYRKYNAYGCPYISAETNLQANDVIIYGHYMGDFDTAMFHDMHGYLNSSYFSEHPEMLVQTPEGNFTLQMKAAEVVEPRSGKVPITGVKTVSELNALYADILHRAQAKKPDLDTHEHITQLFTFITCYDHGNKRCVVYAA